MGLIQAQEGEGFVGMERIFRRLIRLGAAVAVERGPPSGIGSVGGVRSVRSIFPRLPDAKGIGGRNPSAHSPERCSAPPSQEPQTICFVHEAS